MQGRNDPYRGRDLSALIAPDRRRLHAALLVVLSMVAGGLIVLVAEHVSNEMLGEPPPTSREPRVIEHDPIAGDPTMRHRDFIRHIPPRNYDPLGYDPGAHM